MEYVDEKDTILISESVHRFIGFEIRKVKDGQFFAVCKSPFRCCLEMPAESAAIDAIERSY